MGKYSSGIRSEGIRVVGLRRSRGGILIGGLEEREGVRVGF